MFYLGGCGCPMVRTFSPFDQVGSQIEFDKGKSAIVVLSKDKLPTIIDTLIAAVRNGELDEHLAQGSKVGVVKKRKAA